MSGETWTAEREDTLVTLWGEGRSASYIAGELGGGLTRNAVMGKVDRLRSNGRIKPRAGDATETPRAKPRVLPSMPPSSPDAPETVEAIPARPSAPVGEIQPVARAFPLEPRVATGPARPEAKAEREPVTIHALGPLSCRWPVGDPSKPDFGYCGGKAPQGRPYCDHHARMAYEPPRERRRA